MVTWVKLSLCRFGVPLSPSQSPESKFHSHDGAQTITHVHDSAKHRTNYDYLEKRVVLLRGIVMATVTQDLPFSPSPALRARPDCKKLVLLGEIGGIEKYRVIDVVEKVIMKKPIAQALGSMADSDASSTCKEPCYEGSWALLFLTHAKNPRSCLRKSVKTGNSKKEMNPLWTTITFESQQFSSQPSQSTRGYQKFFQQLRGKRQQGTPLHYSATVLQFSWPKTPESGKNILP
ncbi:hypothetical protein JOM56_014663 [Amanita muscaria]